MGKILIYAVIRLLENAFMKLPTTWNDLITVINVWHVSQPPIYLPKKLFSQIKSFFGKSLSHILEGREIYRFLPPNLPTLLKKWNALYVKHKNVNIPNFIKAWKNKAGLTRKYFKNLSCQEKYIPLLSIRKQINFYFFLYTQQGSN